MSGNLIWLTAGMTAEKEDECGESSGLVGGLTIANFDNKLHLMSQAFSKKFSHST